VVDAAADILAEIREVSPSPKPGLPTGLESALTVKNIVMSDPKEGWDSIWKDIESGWVKMKSSYDTSRARFDADLKVRSELAKAAKKKKSGSVWFDTQLQDAAQAKLHANDEL